LFSDVNFLQSVVTDIALFSTVAFKALIGSVATLEV